MTSNSERWLQTDAALATSLTDVRLQFHYAAQFATAIGISFLPALPDDSHTNLAWDHDLRALVSRTTPGPVAIQVAARPEDLSLLVIRDGTLRHALALHRASVAATMARLSDTLAREGLDAGRYSLRRHYEIPPHPVADDGTFDAGDRARLDELMRWYANASLVLEEVRHAIHGSEVRCWPHHFDIATLAEFGGGRSSGAGLSPGDDSYPEPYFYVNAYPAPAAVDTSLPLAGVGTWHTSGWTGAVLPASSILGVAEVQAVTVARFLSSATTACRKLLGA